MLEPLFHSNADSYQLGAGLGDQVDQPVHGLAPGHKIVDDQNPVLWCNPIFGHQERDLAPVCIGKDFALIQAALQVVALCLFGKDHGNPEAVRADGSQCNAAGLGSEDFRNAADVESFCKFFGHQAQKPGIHLVVQETVHFDNVAGKNAAFLSDTCF